MNIAVVLASGVGKRMRGGKNKVLLELGGKPLIFYALDNFVQCDDIDEIVIVAREEEIELMQDLVNWFDIKKIAHIIPGGDERQYSAYNGVQCICEAYDHEDIVVLFHNGANPFVESEEIERVIIAAREHGAAVVGHKTKDTVRKVSDKGFSEGVLNRNELWNMQTPQAIKLEIARTAFEQAKENEFLGTDDVSLVENIGGDVVIVEASDNNFKVTTPIDLVLAETILKNKEETKRNEESE
ncbi:MAG: 2-C-methyl-D-erythritol 4-phosphate cytidylyltransferase [Candidatus Moraniibacteriota bacterium]|nr:MAG: 2-C-methyl-D-erythritol 4-phosphate cytidylyltransferase [Candidatus Moranbacteria bacterium]